MPDSSDIDNALVAKLGADTALLALMPNGVWMNLPPPGSTRYVVVSIVDAYDVPMFGGVAFEYVLYAVKAVELSTPTVPAQHIKAAAARIDALLNAPLASTPPASRPTLTIPGYATKLIRREGQRLRFEEPDGIDNSMVWFHRGGQYRVVVSPVS